MYRIYQTKVPVYLIELLANRNREPHSTPTLSKRYCAVDETEWKKAKNKNKTKI